MKKYCLFILSILSWNTLFAQQWRPVGGGLNYTALTMLPLNNQLFVGGEFLTAGGQPAKYVASWNDTAWSVPGGGMNGAVGSLTSHMGELYAYGGFTVAGGAAAESLAKWSGTSWMAAGTGLGSSSGTLCSYNGKLYAGGIFVIGGKVGMAEWSGTTWGPINGGGMNNSVNHLVVYSGELYAGGAFSEAGQESVSCIARWNGTKWMKVGSGMTGGGGAYPTLVNVMLPVNGVLYAAGNFANAGGAAAANIARWNGIYWAPLGSGINGVVLSMAYYRDELYVGGFFTLAGGVPVKNIAKWDGSSWAAVGNGFNDAVYSLAVYNGSLYAGGKFTLSGSDTVRYIARWMAPQSGIAVAARELQPEIYPNPSNGVFYMTLPADGAYKSLTVTDMAGRTMYSEVSRQNSRALRVELPHAQAGVYTLVLSLAQGVVYGRLVVTD